MKIKQFAIELTQPEIDGGPRSLFAMPFQPNYTAFKKSNVELAWQNAFVDHLLGF
jgi:hypothetical protein